MLDFVEAANAAGINPLQAMANCGTQLAAIVIASLGQPDPAAEADEAPEETEAAEADALAGETGTESELDVVIAEPETTETVTAM